MSDLCKLIWCALIGPFRPRAALQAEILVLRHQLNVLRRKSPKRLAFSNVDRLVFAGLYRVAPGVLDALKILKPQTVIRWHRAGFRAYWGLEIMRARRPAKDTGGHSPTHSRHERREPALGSATDPWRTAQAWHRCRADHRGKIHGQEKAAAIAGLEDLSAQSCRRHCVDGFVRSPDDLVSAVVWTSDPAAFPPRACVAGCDRTPERPLDCPPTKPKPTAGIRRHSTSFAIGIACMALSSSRGFAQWAYGIGRLHRARHGKMDIRRGSSVQSDGIALTMSLCSANDISAICSIPTKNITTKLGRTYRCTRTRQSHVLSRPSVARWRCQFWAGCITNISGRKFPTGTGCPLMYMVVN